MVLHRRMGVSSMFNIAKSYSCSVVGLSLKSQLDSYLRNIVDLPCQTGFNNSLDGEETKVSKYPQVSICMTNEKYTQTIVCKTKTNSEGHLALYHVRSCETNIR